MTSTSDAVYVYGVVPADVQVEDDARGIADAPVEVIREGDIAALVSRIKADHAIGKPEDLQAHAELLDGTASVAPVLPLRFGAVMTDTESVAQELLREHHNDFAEALNALEGHAEYVIKGRYDQKRFLTDLLDENDQARALREDIQGKPEEAARNSRIALGELISNTVEVKRQADTNTVVDQLNDVARQVNVREPTHEWDAVHVALLAEVDREGDVQEVVNRLNEKGKGRLQMRLLGPLAPYDFVVASAPES
jgi:Gas vesicle synthesis protein GvpL/GvpF